MVSIKIGVNDKPVKLPKSPNSFKKLGNKKARKTGSKRSGVSTFELAKKMERKYKIFSRPIKRPQKELKEAMDLLGKAVLEGKKIPKRAIENLTISAIRIPILKKQYGSNRKATILAKGFNLLTVDTGTTFNSIDVRIK